MSSSLLAKAVVTGEQDLVDITCYYTYRKNKYGTLKLATLNAEDAKKMLEDETKKSQVEVLNTKWKHASWVEQNMIVAESQDFNEFTRAKEPNWSRYRDLRIKRLMVDWDLEHENKKVPVTDEYIDRLPAEIVLDLFDKYERATGIDPDEQGK